MRNSNPPRHARVRYGHAGRLHRALLPAALGGMVAGSVWLATDAAAAPVTDHSGSLSDGSSYSAAPSPSYDGRYSNDGSYRDAQSRDAYNGYDGHTSYDEHNSYDQRSYDGHSRYDGRHDYADQRYRDHNDWRTHRDDSRTAAHPQVTVHRAGTSAHRASSARARKDVSSTAPQVFMNAAAPADRAAQETAQKTRAVHRGPDVTSPTSTAPTHASVRLSSAAHSDLAAVDTAHPVTDYVALYGGIGGASLAALLGMGGVALWRRRASAGPRG